MNSGAKKYLLFSGEKRKVSMSTDAANNVTRATSAGSSGDSCASRGNSVTLTNTEAHYNQVSFLPIVHAIIHTIEKDNQDVSQKNRDSLEASQKVAELAKKIETARAHVYKLPGITDSKQVQLQRLQNLHTQLEMKKELISKYKALNMKLGSSAADGNMHSNEGNENVPK